jgi:DNA-binding CsgD family transcriptional regulator
VADCQSIRETARTVFWWAVGFPVLVILSEMAARPLLSVRTVEDDTYKAMTKTGTSSRDQLAALLRGRKPHPK